MSFWDNVKKFAQPYADEDYDDYDEDYDDYEEEPVKETAPRSGRRPSPFGSTQEAPAAAPAAAPVAPAAPSTGFGGSVIGMSAAAVVLAAAAAAVALKKKED